MVCSTPFVHVGDVDLNTKTWKFIQITFKNHYLYSNRFAKLYTVIMDMNVNKDSGSFRNLLTMLTKSMVLEHVMLCMQNYVDHYADIIKNNEHYSLIKNFVMRMTTVSLEEALVDCTQLYERMRMIGSDLHMIDFECQIRKNIDAVNTVLFPSVNSAYGVLQTNIVKLTNKLKDLLVLYNLEDLTLKCQKCKCGNIYHQHKNCSHKLCAKCAFQSLLKVKYCIMCKKLNKIRNREIDNIDHSDSESEYSDNNSSSKKHTDNDDKIINDDDDDDANNDDDLVYVETPREPPIDIEDDDDTDTDTDTDDDDDNDNDNDEVADDDNDNNKVADDDNDKNTTSPIASPSCSKDDDDDDGGDGDNILRPVRRKRIIDRSIFTPSPSPSPPPPSPPQPVVRTIPPNPVSPPPPPPPSISSLNNDVEDEENIENINKHLRQLNEMQNELIAKKQQLNEIINDAEICDNLGDINNVADFNTLTHVSIGSVSTRLPDDDDDDIIQINDNDFPFDDIISPILLNDNNNNNNDGDAAAIINELMDILHQQQSNSSSSSTSKIIEYTPPVQQQSVETILSVQQESIAATTPLPQKFCVIDNTDKENDRDDNDDELSACRKDSRRIIKPETYDSMYDEPFDFFQYQCQDGVVIKLEKDDPVYVETPYKPPDEDDDDDDNDDDDVIIVESSNPLAFKPKRFPIKVTRYAHIVSEEYIGDNDNDDDDDESSQPPSKKIKL
ncbi:ORF4 hoar [Spodoptera exigua multiple nucleopolyhedrovirus]|uniref:ORF4 hoar n=1 Tax=Spodoptera exigua nuclear polyhedrosis virus (strain US) TaxID=31506 RepID=Q9J8C9_NPVSE|nr:ORF4 hoar [Spodoptera exigua multiple nucleopolyhedrovirus]AAF33535.1 ORF4 hoar [Spodoptera exigua multiple nucleopolyhedrovirus]